MLRSNHAYLFLEGRQLLRQGYSGRILAEREKKRQMARPVSLSRASPWPLLCSLKLPVAALTKAQATFGPDLAHLSGQPISSALKHSTWPDQALKTTMDHIAPLLHALPWLLRPLRIKPNVTPAHLSDFISHFPSTQHPVAQLCCPHQWPWPYGAAEHLKCGRSKLRCCLSI